MTERPRHVPLRRCVTCRRSLPKAHLLRLVRSADGWAHDAAGRGGGRGTWLCHDCLASLDTRDTTRALARCFRHDAEQVRALLQTLEVDPQARAAAATPPTPHDSRHGGTHG